MVEKNYRPKNVNTLKDYMVNDYYKTLARTGISDRHKRDFILEYFDLNPITCEIKYETLVKQMGEDFIE